MNTTMREEWFTLDDIQPSENEDTLYCISVDGPDRQFLAGELALPTCNTEEGKAEDEMRGESQLIIGSIARLGRAAGVHLLVATQRPDAKLIPGELKANLTTRVNCGRTDSTASSMILDNANGVRVSGAVRGRMFVQNHGQGHHGQGFFQTQEWIDEWLESKGVNPDGSPLGTAQKRTFSGDMGDFEGADLDGQAGISNEEYIRQLAEEDAQIAAGEMPAPADDFDMGGAPPQTVSENSQNLPEQELPESSIGRPEFEEREADDNPFHRPEDDFDSVLEDLIAENEE